MALNQNIFLQLLLGAFGLTFVGFIVRGTSTLVVGSSTAELVSAPIFLLAILCAIAGFVLSVTIKVRSVLGRTESRGPETTE